MGEERQPDGYWGRTLIALGAGVCGLLSVSAVFRALGENNVGMALICGVFAAFFFWTAKETWKERRQGQSRGGQS